MASNMPTLMGVGMGIGCNTRICHAHTFECRVRSYTLGVTWGNTYINAATIHIDMPLVVIHRFYMHMDTRIR